MPTRRIPNLGHVALFLLIAVVSLLISETLVLAVTGGFHNTQQLATALVDQRLQLIANSVTYVIALGGSWLIFSAMWKRPFAEGIRWNGAAARPVLIVLGLLAGFGAQAVTVLLPSPKDAPIESLTRNPGVIWILVFFGTTLAPLFEEITFRGFLLPAFAIAIDYLRLPKPADPVEAIEILHAWRDSEDFSTAAVVVSSIITSILFGLIHAPQLGLSWPSVGLLATVSLGLCVVRLRTRSVAASTLIHGSYNLSVFLSIFVASGGFRHLDRV